MTRSVRLMIGTTGSLLLVSALVLLVFAASAYVLPWILLFTSAGVGLFAAFIVENDLVKATRRASDEPR